MYSHEYNCVTHVERRGSLRVARIGGGGHCGVARLALGFGGLVARAQVRLADLVALVDNNTQYARRLGVPDEVALQYNTYS